MSEVPAAIANAIAQRVMREDPIHGGAIAQASMDIMPGDPIDSGMIVNTGEQQEGYGEGELRLAKRFVELVGSAERARELVDKVDECQECLEIIEPDDSEAIAQIGDATPMTPDLGMMNPTGMASQYNPGAGGQL